MVYPFQTHLINCFVFVDCENGDIANTEKISNFLTKNKSKYLKEETRILCFFGKNKTLASWKSGVSKKYPICLILNLLLQMKMQI